MVFAQLRTGERFATRQFFAKYKDKLINNYADNKLEYKKKNQVLNQLTVPPSASGLEITPNNPDLAPLLVLFHLISPLHLPASKVASITKT